MSSRRALAGLVFAAMTVTVAPALAGSTAAVDAPGDPAGPPHAPNRPGRTEMASVDWKGRPATAVALPGITTDGSTRYESDNLTACWFSQSLGSTTSYTLLNTGPDISADGTQVVFVTDAALVPEDTNRSCDVYQYDRRTHRTRRVSISSTGAQSSPSPLTGVASTAYASVSADGRYVAFASDASGLVPAGQSTPAWNVYVHDNRTGKTTLASVSSLGVLPTSPGTVLYGAYSPRISGNGRYVVFVSAAAGLAANQPAGVGTERIYRHDVATGQTVLVSAADATGSCNWPAINQSGQVIAYQCGMHLFAADLAAHTNRLILNADPFQPGVCPGVCDTYIGSIGGHALSADGRYLVFISEAPGLVPNKRNSNLCSKLSGRDTADDVFILDLRTGRMRRVSVSSFGEEALWGGGGGDASCWQGGGGINNGAAISADGRFVTFRSMTRFFAEDVGETTFVKTGLPGTPSAQCVSQGTQTCPDDPAAYVYDTLTGDLDWISTTPDHRDPQGSWCKTYGSPPDGNNGQSAPVTSVAYAAALSGDGRYTAFTSCTTDLVPNDHTNQWEVYLRDRGPVLGLGGLAGEGKLTVVGRPSFTRDGFISATPGPTAADDALLDSAGARLESATLAYRPNGSDLFFRETLESMPSVASLTTLAPLIYGARFDVGAVHYEVRVQHALGVDYNPAGGASFGLFRQGKSGAWEKVARLHGGYGTTGQEVVFAIPLSDLNADRGAQLSDVVAYTAVGSFEGGVARVLHHVRLSD
jgi:Tol biopolymer transport system component